MELLPAGMSIFGASQDDIIFYLFFTILIC